MKAGNGLAGACRFVEFLRRHEAMAPGGRMSFDISELTTLAMLVADTPAARKAAVLDLIESKLPRG